MLTNKTFEQENNEILSYIINNGIYPAFQQDPKKRNKDESQMLIECYITPECNQSCSYCYLCQHGKELYPEELRDHDTILKNFKIFIQHCIDNKLFPDRFDLFSGEIWASPLGLNILHEIEDAIINRGFSPRAIIIPSNCSFIFDDKALIEIEEIMTNLSKTNTRLVFSCSNDGKCVDLQNRPFTNPQDYANIEKASDEYYDKLFNFCKKWNFGFHPMVAAAGIEVWGDNFKWWYEQLKKYNISLYNGIMFLEVRNDDWTEDKIISYLKYLNSSIEYLKNEAFTSLEVAKSSTPTEIFNLWRFHKLPNQGQGHYSPLRIYTGNPITSCTIHRSLVVRMGDLAIVPCHRTSYEELILGHYEVKEDKIIGIKAKNIQMANQIWLNNLKGAAGCNHCAFAPTCMKGCLGAQLEANQDLLYPCSTVCDLYKARITFLYHKYKKDNIFTNDYRDQEILKFIDSIKETKEFKKWTEVALQII